MFNSTFSERLSYRIRDRAANYGIDDMRHWMLQLIADRVNAGESVVANLARGKVPNFLRSQVHRSQDAHVMEETPKLQTIKRFTLAAGITAVLVGAAVYLSKQRRF